MELYKERDFGAIISDSFLFFKKNGKNYFKNYLAINGGLLLLLILLIVVGFNDIISQFFQSNMGDRPFIFEQFFEENPIIFISISLLIVILFIIIGVINYTFPIVYLDLYGKLNRADFSVSELVDKLRNNIGKMLIFMIFTIFILTPLAFVVLGLNILLIFLIIGLFLFLITFPAITNITNFTLFDYILTEKGIFDAFGTAFKIQFSKNFWKYIGVTLVLYLIIQIATFIFTFFPAFFAGIGSAVNPSEGGLPIVTIITIVTYVLSMVVSLIASNIIYIATGFMYFDSRKDLHQMEHFKEIDSIGQS